MPNTSEMKASTYFKKEDLTQPVILTIKSGSFAKRNLARADEEPAYKWTVGFEEDDRSLVLNTDKIDTMAEIFGSTNTDDWEGKKIVLYVDPNVKFGGRKVGGIRVRAPKQQPRETIRQEIRKPVSQINEELAGGVEEMDDDIPF